MRVMSIVEEPKLCSLLRELDFDELFRVINEAARALDRLRPVYLRAKRRKSIKKYNGRTYTYYYIEVFDRQGTKYTKPKPILRIREDSEEANRVVKAVEAEAMLAKLHGVLREARFLIDELRELGGELCL